ncbi:MAG: hypothetical protein ACRC1M_00435 [Methanobacteriaceae archaeon]
MSNVRNAFKAKLGQSTEVSSQFLVPEKWVSVFKNRFKFSDEMIQEIEFVSVGDIQMGSVGTNSIMDVRNFSNMYGYDLSKVKEQLQLAGDSFVLGVGMAEMSSSENNRGKVYLNFGEARILPNMVKENKDGYTVLVSFEMITDESCKSSFGSDSIVRMLSKKMTVEVKIILKKEEESTPEENQN